VSVDAGSRSAAFRAILRDPRLRRIQLAEVGSLLGGWSYVVALGVYAYEVGGPVLVGVATLARLAPVALTASLSGALADRLTRRGLMIRCDLARAGLLLVIAGLMGAGAPAGVVLALVAVASAVGAWFSPAKAALVPALTRKPEELTAMNVVSGGIENVGMFGGPALGGILLAATSPQVVFAATASALLWSAWQVHRIDFDEPRKPVALNPAALVSEVRDGIAAIAGSGPLRVMMGLLTAQTFVAGALSVLVVVVAIGELERGPEWAGYLEGAAGVGGIAGAIAATTLVGRRRLSGTFGLSMVFWGAPLALLAIVISPVAALAVMFVNGVANSVGDVAYLTMLQRAVPEDRIARVFGGLDAVLIGAMALGGLACSLLVEAVGISVALAVFALLLPALTAVAWPGLRRIDADAPPPPERVLTLLRAVPMFGVLPAPVLEALAFAATHVDIAAGEAVFSQGDRGDRYYVVDSGAVDVLVDDRRVREQGPGSGFGEIALVRDVPRTATVRALGPVSLWALERDDFLAALGGTPESADGAERIAAARLSYARPALGAL